MPTAEGSYLSREAVRRWRQFASETTVTYKGETRSWAAHITHREGYADEEQLVQPRVFPLFVRDLLDFEVGISLAAEKFDRGGRPDFTPADAVTHPFIFEIKSTNLGTALQGWDNQVLKYLTGSSQRIKRVVLTNLVGLKVLELDNSGQGLVSILSIDLGQLLLGDLDMAAALGSAQDLERFLRDYRRRALSPEEKLQKARCAWPWVPALETTDADWLSARLDNVVVALTGDVRSQVAAGVLGDDAQVHDVMRAQVEGELQQLEWRLADTTDPPSRDLAAYVAASPSSLPGKALAQYEAHVAYFFATRILLVRVFEDLGLLDPVLYDGGLNNWLERLQDALSDVVTHSFRRARRSYPSLFDQSNAYTWFEPRRDALVEVIYELANTFLGAIESDVLGSVYERLLERVDRKLLGQYYTPRDVISLIWDLVGVDELMETAEDVGRPLRVLDIASGSGGFLVEGARRLRTRFAQQKAQGSALSAGDWVRTASRGLTGVEIQRFPAYLGELNLLIQIALGASVGIAEGEGRPAIPPLGIVCHDTLATHNPIDLFGAGDGSDSVGAAEDRSQFTDPARQQRFADLCDPSENGAWFDVTIGNPPYVGEKTAAKIIDRTRRERPYWAQFHTLHMDYLSWFLILGISKLREGGRFGFITSEYWLRATGASKLRRYLAQHCEIERLILFRDMRLFPDAPGHHSLVVTGRRVVMPGDLPDYAGPASPDHKPMIHFVTRPAARDRSLRPVALDDIRRSARNTVSVKGFPGRVSPGALLAGSWSEVIMTRDQISRRRRIQKLGGSAPAVAAADEGVITGADRMRAADRDRLGQETLNQLDTRGVRGIFVLTAEEVSTLGDLNDTETERLRTIINTRDVYPYACVPDDDGRRMLYLPRPDDLARARHELGSDDAEESVGNALPFDLAVEMPNFERHLTRFKPILDAKIAAFKENRPWWTIHRGRPRIGAAEGAHETWAQYALTSRWGESHNLTVGLAPRRSVPQSSMHALIPTPDSNAAYLAALFNSGPIQSLADAFGPGQLRMDEILDLLVPLLPDPARHEITAAGYELANLVTQLVRSFSSRWPTLTDDLRADPTLTAFDAGAWTPADFPAARRGTLSTVTWVDEVTPKRVTKHPIREIVTEHTLFGDQVVAVGDGARRQAFRLREDRDDLREALVARLNGAAAAGAALKDLAELPVPISGPALASTLRDDRAALALHLDRYRQQRKIIDDHVLEALEG